MTRGKLVKVGVAAAVLTAGGAIAGEAVKPDVKTNDVKPVVVSERIQKEMDDFKLTRGMETDKKELRKTSEDLTDEYEWRWMAVFTDTSGVPASDEYLKWTYKKNGSPITNSTGGDTTYTLTVGGEEYLCGVYADTLIFPDSSDARIVTYTYRQGTMEELTSRWEGIYMNKLSFASWDPMATNWIEYVRIRGPPIRGIISERFVRYFETTIDSTFNQSGGTSMGGNIQILYTLNDPTNYLSIPLSIHESENKPMELNMSVYPNPTNARFSVKLPEQMTDGTVTLYTINGEIVDKKIIDGREVTFDASDLSSGKYLIRAQNSEYDVHRNVVIIK